MRKLSVKKKHSKRRSRKSRSKRVNKRIKSKFSTKFVEDNDIRNKVIEIYNKLKDEKKFCSTKCPRSTGTFCINEGSGGHVEDFINFYSNFVGDKCSVSCGKKLNEKKNYDNEVFFYIMINLISNNKLNEFRKFIPIFYNEFCYNNSNSIFYRFENVGNDFTQESLMKFDFKIGYKTYYQKEKSSGSLSSRVLKNLRMDSIDANSTTKIFGFRLEGPYGADFRLYNNKLSYFANNTVYEFNVELFKNDMKNFFKNSVQILNYSDSKSFIDNIQKPFPVSDRYILNKFLDCNEKILTRKTFKKVRIKMSRYEIHPFIIFDFLFQIFKNYETGIKYCNSLLQNLENFYSVLNMKSDYSIASIGSSLLLMCGLSSNGNFPITKVCAIDFAHSYIYQEEDEINGLNIKTLQKINENYNLGILNLMTSLKLYLKFRTNFKNNYIKI